MSAGICVMNKMSIALAADSAITIGNHSAIHNSANKVFELSKKAPVGAIIYANAQLMGIPFEILIKEFSKRLGTKELPELRDYFECFISYLEENTELYGFGLNEKNYVFSEYKTIVKYLCDEYKKQIEKKVQKVKRKLKGNELTEIKKETIESMYSIIKRFKKIKDFNFSMYVKQTYLSELEKLLSDSCEWIPKNRLKKISRDICDIYDLDFFFGSYVGMAIAGYGSNNIFPKMVHVYLGGVINKKVRFKIVAEEEIDDKRSTSITPLAQTDVMQTFLFGINDSFIQEIADAVTKQINIKMESTPDSDFATGKKETVVKSLKEAVPDIVKQIVERANKNYMAPIWQSVATLPVEELTSFAESMINITSVRRQVAIDGNIGTVGGPIDVASITKGEGFVWLKKKHYFDTKDNLQYIINRLNDIIKEG